MKDIKEKSRTLYEFLFRNPKLRQEFSEIIFGTDTPIGKLFDVVLIWFIILSVLITIAESVVIPQDYKYWLQVVEWVFTAFFTLEFIMRLYVSDRPIKYVFSFFGMIDLLSILPSYLALLFPTAHALMVIRIFRIIRVFRIFKLVAFMDEAQDLINALKASMRKIIVFAVFVLLLVIAIGAILYMIEGDIEGSSFSSIPQSIYWAVVTLTTVGYGDITPVTPAGQFLTTIVMLLGYTILSVPTGIFSVSLMDENDKKRSSKRCLHCGKRDQDADAKYCRHCGRELYDKDAKLDIKGFE